MTIAVNNKVGAYGLINMAGSAAQLKIYTAPQPSAGAAATGTLLGTVTMGSTLGVISDVSTHWRVTFNASTPDTSADADGDAAWARLQTSTGTWIADLDVGVSGTAITMPSVTVYSGGEIRIISGVVDVLK